MRTRSGDWRFLMAVPSDRNSGFDRISKGTAGRAAASSLWMIWAVPQGTVDFSTRIALGFAHSAISRTELSKAERSVAWPAPRPEVLVGVLTASMMRSDSAITVEQSVLKKRFG